MAMNTTFRRAKDVDMLLAEYFPKGVASIKQLIALIIKRKELLLPTGIMSYTPDVAIKQINEVAFIRIDNSINKYLTEKHVVLIKMLLMEEAVWARLKQALADNNPKEINRCIVGLNSILDNELRLIPANANAQVAFVKMTREEMEKAAKLR
jgi:hypothetical protein